MPTLAAPPPPFQLVDATASAPVEYRRSVRPLSQSRAAVLHQMGVGTWRDGNPMFARVRAHFVVKRSGVVLQLHPLTCRMRYGSGAANPWAITIECEGNYPTRYRDGVPLYYSPDKFGRSVLADAPAQVEAARALLAWLAAQVSGLQVGTHRQISKGKAGCCGPDLWREVGQWAADALDLPLMPTLPGGLEIPDEWRGPPRININPNKDASQCS